MTCKYWWIKERYNPQLPVYYVYMGKMPIKRAKRYEDALYGDNIMHRYETKEAYDAAVRAFKAGKGSDGTSRTFRHPVPRTQRSAGQ